MTFVKNVTKNFQKLFQTLLKISGLTIPLFLQGSYMNFKNKLSFLNFLIKKVKSL